MRKLYIDDNLDINSDKAILAGDFINFCADNLPIDGNFKIYLVSNRENHDIATTAAYHRGKNIIKIYCKNRALVDILRSLAHEMTHLMQDEKGELQGIIQDAGGYIEDQANAKAGELIKLFAKSMPERRAIYESVKKKLIL
tara:strand:+ start:4197 stop:4619 length:423 start_codon:yes stop_codon:yes gene_type:complete